MEGSELSISFDSQYKGHKKDNLKTRISSFTLFIVVGLTGIFFGLYCILQGGFQEKTSNVGLTNGLIFMILGVLLIATSPLSFLFGGTMNKRCQGKVTIRFFKPNLEWKLWRYELRTTYKKKTLEEHGDIDNVEDKKKYAVISLDTAQTLHIPYSEITEEEKKSLLAIGKEVQEYLAEETRKRKEYHSGSNLDQ